MTPPPDGSAAGLARGVGDRATYLRVVAGDPDAVPADLGPTPGALWAVAARLSRALRTLGLGSRAALGAALPALAPGDVERRPPVLQGIG